MPDPANIHDAFGHPRRAERQPDLSPAELKLGTAAERWVRAKDALEAHVRYIGASGPEHATLLASQQTAWREFMDACWGYPLEPRAFEDPQ